MHLPIPSLALSHRWKTSLKRAGVLFLALGASAPLQIAPPALAEEVNKLGYLWEPAGPISSSSGMSAIETDPQNPNVIWVGSMTSLWVSEDGGESFSLVMQLPRNAGLVRDNGNDAEEEEASESEEEDEEAVIEEDTGELFDGAASTGDGAEVSDELVNEFGESRVDLGLSSRLGIARLRVIGDKVYVCSSRGLYTVERSARTLGSSREVRFGRRVAVNDVMTTPDGSLWVATDSGLMVVSEGDIARPVRGLEEDLSVRAMLVSKGRLFLATSRGLRIASADQEGFERLAIGAREDAGLEDIVEDSLGRIIVAGASQVATIFADPNSTAIFVEDAAQVPGASRVALGPNGERWAVGSSGAWRFDVEKGWVRESFGLFDRRLVDIGAAPSGNNLLWAAGRSGAWRLVRDDGRGLMAGMGRRTKAMLKDMPTDDDVLEWATKARGSSLQQIEGWQTREKLSWMLPTFHVRYRHQRVRDEDWVLLSALDRYRLEQVDITPGDHYWRIMFQWDVAPAMLANQNASNSFYETARMRARRQQERVREVVMPLYANWAQSRITMEQREPASARDAARELLRIFQLEADLHVYTGGRFPVSTDK